MSVVQNTYNNMSDKVKTSRPRVESRSSGEEFRIAFDDDKRAELGMLLKSWRNCCSARQTTSRTAIGKGRPFTSVLRTPLSSAPSRLRI